MKGYKVTSVLLICILCALAEEQHKDDQQLNSVKRTEKIVLQKSQPYSKRSIKEEPSFLSKLKSWIFPFGGNDSTSDSISAPGHHFTPKYLPPPNHNQEYKPNCNPCNREPWVPVFTNYGKNTIIGFVQPSGVGNPGPYNGHDISNLEHLHPPAASVNNQYGPPHNNVPISQYGPPHNNIPITQYGPPQGGPPPQEYGPPPNGIPPQQYGPPLNDHAEYGPPPAIQSNIPFKEYGPPHIGIPGEEYGPPLKNPPPQDLPLNVNPIREYGPPPNGPQAHVYGPPSNPPRQHGQDPPPYRQIGPHKQIRQMQYGPPSIRPPRPEYGPPFAQYGPPPHTTKQKLPPIPTDHFMPPPFHKQKHGPPRFIPRQNGKYPSNKYGPPSFVPANMMPPPINGYMTNYGVPNQFNNHGPPNPPPSSQILPSPFPSDSYGKPVTGSNIDYGISSQANKGEYLHPLKDLSLLSSNNDDIQISQSIPLPVFDEIVQMPNEPIAFPNLNYLPVLPLRNPQNFHPDFIEDNHDGPHQEIVPNQSTKVEVQVGRDVYNGGGNLQRVPQNFELQQGTTVEVQRSKESEIYHGNSNNFANNFIDTKTPSAANNHHREETVTDVQIVPSITVANFLSSIEYPINLIQSPVVDVTASEFEENKGAHIENGYSADPIKLSSNPIIVETSTGDSHPSASALNGTLHGSNLKRGNDKDLSIPNSVEQQNIAEVPHPAAINQFLENPSVTYHRSKDVAYNPTKFTPTPADYVNWSPSNTISTSMIPPPPGESSWLSTMNGVGEQIITTTLKPKPVQIIIPYTTINKAKPHPHELLGRKVPPYAGIFEPKLSLYTQPPRTESVWLEHMDDAKKATTAIYSEKPKMIINIKDLLKKEQDKNFIENLPFDIISLQKNIDGWTEQEYSRQMNRFEYQKASTVSQWIPSKKIPAAYLTTNSYNITSSTPHYNDDDYDHEPAGSNNKEATFNNNFESNFIFTDTTTEFGTTEDFLPTEYPEINDDKSTTKSAWNGNHPMYSSLIKDNVYVVTPQPHKQEISTASAVAFSDPPKIGGKEFANGFTNVTYLSRSIDNEVKPLQKTKTDFNDSVRIIYSDWPHLINNLETTTKKSTTTRHPLFGQIDLSSYISPPNSTVRTFTGHSKVITVVTPISLSRRKSDVNADSPVSITTTTEVTKI